MSETTRIDKSNWPQMGFSLPAPLGGLVIDAAIERGWSLETCARIALIRFAESKGVKLDHPGFDVINVGRKSEAKLRAHPTRKFWIKYPRAWAGGVESPLKRLIDMHPKPLTHFGQMTLTEVWRDAMAWWVTEDLGLKAGGDQDDSEAA